MACRDPLSPEQSAGRQPSGSGTALRQAGTEGGERDEQSLRLLFVKIVERDGAPGDLTYDDRWRRVADVLQKESGGRVTLRTELATFAPDPEGGTGLRYDRQISEWHRLLTLAFQGRDYDVLAFGPSRAVPWCHDSHSIGYFVEGRAFLCVEPSARTDLLLHKLMHPYGFAHQEKRQKQLLLLGWRRGFPGSRASDRVALTPAGRSALREPDLYYASPMAQAALGVVGLGSLPGSCPRPTGLRCLRPAPLRWACVDRYGPRCLDVDGDGLIDGQDSYPLTPPGGGPDSDGDGVPDRLDRCPGTRIHVDGAQGGIMNLRATGPSATLRFSVPGARVRRTGWTRGRFTPRKVIGENWYYPGDPAVVTNGGRVHIPTPKRPATAGSTGDIPIRVTVFYEKGGRELYRPYYLQSAPDFLTHIHEKEWFYVLRFGCDVPSDLRFFDHRTYDADADGFLDRSDVFARPLGERYDWDGDGTADRRDALPTVAGACTHGARSGVMDSDGDGICDPGRFSFSGVVALDETYFGELPVVLGDGVGVDWCPYVKGTPGRRGCPPADGGPRP